MTTVPEDNAQIMGALVALYAMMAKLIATHPQAWDFMANFDGFTDRLRTDAIYSEKQGNADIAEQVNKIALGAEEAIAAVSKNVTTLLERAEKT